MKKSVAKKNKTRYVKNKNMLEEKTFSIRFFFMQHRINTEQFIAKLHCLAKMKISGCQPYSLKPR